MRILYYNLQEGEDFAVRAALHKASQLEAGVALEEFPEPFDAEAVSGANIAICHHLPVGRIADKKLSLLDAMNEPAFPVLKYFIVLEISRGKPDPLIRAIPQRNNTGVREARYHIVIHDTFGAGLVGDSPSTTQAWREVIKAIVDMREQLGRADAESGSKLVAERLGAFICGLVRDCNVLAILAILCQGYLAVYAKASMEEQWHDTGVFEALNRMGCISDCLGEYNNVRRYRIAPEVAGLTLPWNLREVQDGMQYWLKVFREGAEEDACAVIKRVRQQARNEWDEAKCGDIGMLNRLLTRLEHEDALDGERAPKEVADAYCAIADQLG